MSWCVIVLLISQLPFSVPDSLIFKMPDTVYYQRDESSLLHMTKIYKFLATQRSMSLSLNEFYLRRDLLPVYQKNLSYSNLRFLTQFKNISIEIGGIGREYEDYVALEDSAEVALNTRRIFLAYKVKNWTDYFPNLPHHRVKTYAVSYVAAGCRFRSFVPYLNFERVNQKNQVYGGLAYIFRDGVFGIQVKGEELDAVFLTYKLKGLQMHLVFENNNDYSGVSPVNHIVADTTTYSRKLSKSNILEAEISIPPFSFDYKRMFYDKYLIPEIGTYKPVYISHYLQKVYTFGIFTESFRMGYCHFDGPSQIIRDTLFVSLLIKEKYYDLNLHFNFRNHQTEIGVVNMEFILRAIKDINPYIKINNIFDVSGDFLPGIKHRRRFLEIGCELRKEI
jgi:hypothetical protein